MLGITTSSFNAAEDYIMRDLFSQPYSHYIISSMIGFLMLFRVQLSYQRYWFALQHQCESLNRLNCAAGMVIAFDEVASGGPAWAIPRSPGKLPVSEKKCSPGTPKDSPGLAKDSRRMPEAPKTRRELPRPP